MQIVWLWLVFNVLSIVILVPHCSTEDPSCFHVTTVNCTEALKRNEKCTILSDTSTSQVYCCNITSESELREHLSNASKTSSRSILGFHLRDSNISRLGINVFNELPDLVSLSITENSISKFEGNFDKHHALSCFNISMNKLIDISPQLVVKLRSLKNLDMSKNNISFMPDLPYSLPSFFKLDVSENWSLECRFLINLTLMMDNNTISVTFVNKNLTYCLPPNAKLFDSVQHVKWENLETIKVIFRDCPVIQNVKCECSVYSLDILEKNKYSYQALVNCSNRQMMTLPRVLPPNTRVLDISNNSITTFEGIGNETYSTIRELYADNNRITSLKNLEGTSFLDNFQNLTLRNNKIDQIQDYLLSNVFDRNLGKKILLAKNELKCDCHTASYTKHWLTANKAHIPDYDQIFAICEPPIKVLDLDQKDVCSKPTNWKDYIRYIIILEVTMFVLLFGKVSYDYYIFKTAGYLPWPASKMPKLPCDWCFET